MMAMRICVGCNHFRLFMFPTTFTEEHGIQYHASFVYKSLLVLEGQNSCTRHEIRVYVMKIKNLFLLAFVIMLTSCSSMFMITTYDVELKHVEVPLDVKEQFGESKIMTLSENEITKYTYEDDYVAFTWFVSSTQFNFSLRNKTTHSIKIPWDEIAYINPNGQSMRVIHSGIKLIDRNNAQAPSVVAKNSTLDDILIPSDHIYYVSGQYGGWREKNLFGRYDSQEEANTSKYKGATVSIVFPIIIENITNEYTFQFEVKDIIVK